MILENITCEDCTHKYICKYKSDIDKMADEVNSKLQCILKDFEFDTVTRTSNFSFDMKFRCDNFKQDRTCGHCHFIGLNNDDCDVCKRIEKEKEEDYPLVNENKEGCCYWIKR